MGGETICELNSALGAAGSMTLFPYYIILSIGFANTGLNSFTDKENEIQRAMRHISVYLTKYKSCPAAKGPSFQGATHSFPCRYRDLACSQPYEASRSNHTWFDARFVSVTTETHSHVPASQGSHSSFPPYLLVSVSSSTHQLRHPM